MGQTQQRQKVGVAGWLCGCVAVWLRGCVAVWLAYYISLAIICCLDISTSACRHRGWADSQDASQEQGGLHHFQVRLSQDIIIICKSVMCRVEKSEYFTRKGADVYTEASISLAQSALGGSVRVQGISEDINIQIPAGTSSHTR